EEAGGGPVAGQGDPQGSFGLPGKRLSPARRRDAVAHVQQNLPGVSERRACRVMDQPRSTLRYRRKAVARDDEPAIVKRMHELVRRWPRFGYRRVWALLRRDGFKINRKRVHRLWRKEGLKVPRKVKK